MRDNNEPHSFGSINRGSTPTQRGLGENERRGKGEKQKTNRGERTNQTKREPQINSNGEEGKA
jgi:hypothetical protein